MAATAAGEERPGPPLGVRAPAPRDVSLPPQEPGGPGPAPRPRCTSPTATGTGRSWTSTFPRTLRAVGAGRARGAGRRRVPPLTPGCARSLPGPALHPRRILAVPEVSGAVGGGIPWEGTPPAHSSRPPYHDPRPCSGCSGCSQAAPAEPSPQPGCSCLHSKEESGFAAPSLVSQGVALVAVGYDTAPRGRCCPAGAAPPTLARCPPDSALCAGHMDAMVLQVRRSVVFLVKQFPATRWAPRSSWGPLCPCDSRGKLHPCRSWVVWCTEVAAVATGGGE